MLKHLSKCEFSDGVKIKTAIIVFVYARVDHAQRTIESLRLNIGASKHDLIVYSDAPSSDSIYSDVNKVREYLNSISGFRSVTINSRPFNYGLAKSIIDGVTEVLSCYERVIVLEDDMITSAYFLSYMNQALDRFANDERVISIHGYCYPVKDNLPEAFFLRGADCWGWATWRRGWELFNPNGQILLHELKRRKLIKEFDFNGAYGFSKMLESKINGTNDSWAILWHASAFLADKMTLYPGRSLVNNIGNDNTGTHCGSTFSYDVKLSDTPINLSEIEIRPSEIGRGAFERFFRESQRKYFFSNRLKRLKKILIDFLS